MEYRLDMTNMFTIHDAFRRNLVEIARVADHDGSPRLQSQLGWELFKKFLLVHHQTEDDVVWPVLRTHLKDDPDRVAVVDELEARAFCHRALVHSYRRGIGLPRRERFSSCRSRR